MYNTHTYETNVINDKKQNRKREKGKIRHLSDTSLSDIHEIK